MVDWLAGKRVRGTSSERPSLGIDLGGTGVGGWVELGRTTLGSNATTITVSSLSNKRYLKVLYNMIDNGTNTQIIVNRFGNSSVDTGSNYAERYNSNGAGTDGTSTSFTYANTGGADQVAPEFAVQYIANYSTQEKSIQSHAVGAQADGAGTAPNRRESVSKWVNTSNHIDVVQALTNFGTRSYGSGSEVVVLGWDPADSHTNNFWQELASVNSAGAEDSFNTGTFTAKKYLWIQIYTEAESGTINPYLRVGNSTLDTGSNYAQRYSTNGAADSTLTSQTWLALDGVTPASGETTFTNIFIINNASQEKLFIIHSVESEASAATNAPSRLETVCKWANTSSQINIIGLYNNSGTGDFSSKTQIKVWGAD